MLGTLSLIHIYCSIRTFASGTYLEFGYFFTYSCSWTMFSPIDSYASLSRMSFTSLVYFPVGYRSRNFSQLYTSSSSCRAVYAASRRRVSAFCRRLSFFISRIKPVSYTHLDVYKRQVYHIWGKSNCARLISILYTHGRICHRSLSLGQSGLS